MTPDAEHGSGFKPHARREPESRGTATAATLRAELIRIRDRCTSVAQAGRGSFTEGSPSCDVASMALIRLASLLEKRAFNPYAALLTEEEVGAIKATRNIVAHAGYVGVNDDLFWATVTNRLPELLDRLLDQPQQHTRRPTGPSTSSGRG